MRDVNRVRMPARIPTSATQPRRAGCDEDSTGTPRNVHEPVAKGPYSEIVVKGAFVIRLRNAGTGVTENMEGSVEEIDSGREAQFHSGDELLTFLRECFTRSHRTSINEGKK